MFHPPGRRQFRYAGGRAGDKATLVPGVTETAAFLELVISRSGEGMEAQIGVIAPIREIGVPGKK